jgi:Holliday junction resolvase RusA-like endonuclease
VCRRGAATFVYTPDNGIRAYRQAIALRVRAAMNGSMLSVAFEFERPPSHWKVTKKRGRELKATAPAWPVAGDSDNFVKGVKDCLNGVAWRDDKQVTTEAITKRYKDAPRTIITIEADDL